MWSSKSLGSRVKYGFFRALIKLRLDCLAWPLLWIIPLYYAINPRTKARSLPWLERRFPGSGSFARFCQTFRLYKNYAFILFDRMRAGAGRGLPVAHDPLGAGLIQEALKKGRGCVVVSAHAGCWQNGLIALADLGAPVGVVFWQEEKTEHAFFAYERDVEMINACGGLEAAMRMRALLKRNGILCFMGDRLTPGDKAWAEARFAGGSIRVPLFPYQLAERSGCPVFHAAAVRRAGAIAGLCVAPAGESGKEAEAFAAWLEDFAVRHPYEFFNFYDMWAFDDEDGDN